jgi:hypothetical protein
MRILVAIAILLLAGCVTPQERAARAFRAAADTCTSIGIPEGHKDRWKCEVRAADMIERDRQARADAMFRAGIQMMQPPSAPPPPPVPVLCVPVMRNGSYWCQ